MNKHKCLAPGCPRTIDARYLMCGVHWRLVPAATQKKVYAAYVPGQDITTASPAWHAAADEAVFAVQVAQGGPRG